MTSTKARPPLETAFSFDATLYQSGVEAEKQIVLNGRATISRIQIVGPLGQRASAFLSVIFDGRAWYAEVSHDATDYTTERTSYREKRVKLQFFRPQEAQS